MLSLAIKLDNADGFFADDVSDTIFDEIRIDKDGFLPARCSFTGCRKDSSGVITAYFVVPENAVSAAREELTENLRRLALVRHELVTA